MISRDSSYRYNFKLFAVIAKIAFLYQLLVWVYHSIVFIALTFGIIPTMDVVTELQRPSVHIKDREKVDKILKNIIDSGADRLQVITDFDRTISKFKHNEKINPTTHGIFDQSEYLSESYRKNANELRDFYYQIEIDPKLTIAEKCPYMVEWWTKSHNLLLQLNLRKEMIKNIVKDSNCKLRDGTAETFQILNKLNVPCLIFSAGIGDILQEVIKLQNPIYENMKIISNFMDFNGGGILIGFRGELIHSFNKNESAIHNSEYFELLQNRDNVILLGDSVGDVRMAEGATAKNMLKIGFLNDKIDDHIEHYKNIYDIVLVSDETWDIPNAIFKQLS